MIKRLSAEDVDSYKFQVENMISLCIESTYSGMINIAEKRESMKNHLKDGSAYVFGFFQGEILAGFLWGYPYKSVEGIVFHIAYIAVLPQWRGLGIGKELIGAAEETARKMGIANVELIVAIDNESALSMYNSAGFVERRKILTKNIFSSEEYHE